MKYANDYSGYGNTILYRMCEEKPLHDDLDVVRSKLWIIGRAYSASIERKAGKDFKIDDVANILIESEIDQKIRQLNEIGRINESNMDELLSAHEYLMLLLKKATDVEKRSLASKYLHFHAPMSVFIYDSVVRNKLRCKLREIGKTRFPVSKRHDDEYESHVIRCIYYRDNVYEKELGALATPRKLDAHLYGY